MNPYDPLLAPISPERPCGEDISYAPEFLELDSLIQGKGETQFSEAVEPDWKLAQSRCLELLGKSKHLHVATVLCLTSLQVEELPGAANALEFLAKLARQDWESLYPRLDPEDDNDPLERMNILAALTAPSGTFGDAFRFIERLSEAPLTHSPRLGRLSLASQSESGDTSADAAHFDAAFRDTPIAELTATSTAVRQAVAAVDDLRDFLAQLPGGDKAPSFDPLLARLREIGKTVAPYVQAVPVAGAESAGNVAPLTSADGAIQSRHDVIAALDRICAFYAESEPSSPVPLLLRRARRLVHGDFLTIMADLAPDSVSHLRTVTGVKDAPAE